MIRSMLSGKTTRRSAESINRPALAAGSMKSTVTRMATEAADSRNGIGLPDKTMSFRRQL
jgi:hypothetical protein